MHRACVEKQMPQLIGNIPFQLETVLQMDIMSEFQNFMKKKLGGKYPVGESQPLPHPNFNPTVHSPPVSARGGGDMDRIGTELVVVMVVVQRKGEVVEVVVGEE